MSIEANLAAESAEELFEQAPCAYLTTDLDGTILRVNHTFESWTGYDRGELIGRRRFADLLGAGGRIYHETHYAPLLMMQGEVREIALEIRRADGSMLPALVNSVLRRDLSGEPRVIRTTLFDATDRRRYEQELLAGRRREREIARRLQRSMLGGRLPVGERFEVQTYYAPAVETLEVGGDWWDAFWLGRETIGLVVGDVVGRGLEAAATMGQLRSAVRALAATGLAPAALLGAMDAYTRRHELGQTTTMIYAQLDVGTGTLRYACAGHPPPAVLEPGAEPRFMWEGRSWPLDVPFDDAQRPEATCRLASGATVLMYTDGLVEHRQRPLGDGMNRLLAELGRRRDEPLATLVPAVAEALAEPSQNDDVCLIGVWRA